MKNIYKAFLFVSLFSIFYTVTASDNEENRSFSSYKTIDFNDNFGFKHSRSYNSQDENNAKLLNSLIEQGKEKDDNLYNPFPEEETRLKCCKKCCCTVS